MSDSDIVKDFLVESYENLTVQLNRPRPAFTETTRYEIPVTISSASISRRSTTRNCRCARR